MRKGNIIPLKKYRKYNAYQVMLEVHAAEGCDMNADMRYRRTILWIMDWLKARRNSPGAEDSEAVGSEVSEMLSQYPEPDGYEGFDPGEITDFEPTDSEEMRICSYTGEDEDGSYEQWSLQLNEPGDRNETLISDISIRNKEGRVFLAVRGAIKLPTDSEEKITYYRPKFVRKIISDYEKLRITEAGTDIKFAFGKKAHHINGKSGEECREFMEGFLTGSSRQLPVYIISKDGLDRLGDEKRYVPEGTEIEEGQARSILDAAAYASEGYAHLFVLEGSVRKLFVGTEYEAYMHELEKGELLRFGGDVSPIDYGGYFKLNEKRMMTGSFMDEVRSLMERFPYDFRDMVFYQELRIRKKEEEIRKILGGGEIDPEKLLAELKDREETISSIQNEREQENEDHKQQMEEMQNKIKKLSGDLEKARNHSASLKEQQSLLKEDNQALSDKVEKAEAEINKEPDAPSLSFEDYAKMHQGILNPPATYSKDLFTDWIEHYYPDTIILHSKAERSLNSSNAGEEKYRKLAAMIHYLHGCTLYWNEGNRDFDTEKNVFREYVPYNYSFEIAPVGDQTTGAYKSEYQLDISEYDSDAGTVIMSQHIKCGKGFGDDDSLVRLYYYYDRKIGKSIIGSMPNHLPTFSGGR